MSDERPQDVDDEERAPLSWGGARELDDRRVPAHEPMTFAVVVRDPKVQRVRFSLDGKELDVCDATDREDDCRRGSLWRFATVFQETGAHTLTATYDGPNGAVRAEQTIEVVSALPVVPEPPQSAGNDGAGQGVAAADDRGYLDPNLGSHNIFGGVKWSVQSQKVNVASPPAEQTTAAKNCMARYGASIRKWADKYKISRGSVVATALTESNCTNPAGSGDGLSSGPMQVTGSTCASITGLSKATCKSRMHSNPDFSFEVGVRYMASSYQLNQHKRDPPKVAAAYNAGSLRSSTANRWHMVVTGNHIDRFVGGYNGYRAWEGVRSIAGEPAEGAVAPELSFEGEHVERASELPKTAKEGQVYFVGNWSARDGHFVEFHNGGWASSEE
ncbi:transglycosylase SLT domain-containing protein [Pendulispora albinea]|uniref:Lytic transglycosylase domain-containing protein n=1 Tax=Pendulispora albinea TaxID=2741071 RepID=A0ABZ2LXT6_9BACT